MHIHHGLRKISLKSVQKKPILYFSMIFMFVSDFELQGKKAPSSKEGAGCFHSDGVSSLASCREIAQATNDLAGHLRVESTCFCLVPDCCFSRTSELRNERKDAELQITIAAWMFLF